MLPSINRYVAVVKIRKPFADWADSVARTTTPFDVDEHNSDPSAYLLPISNSWQEDRQRMLKKRWREIFESELESIYTDESLWPHPRTFVMFKKWFDVTVCSIVFDTVNEEIEKEESDDEDDDPLNPEQLP